jgi:hypothetical protein
MPLFSKFETCPREILDHIAILLVTDSFLGPPTDLATLLRVSKTIWKSLSLKFNPYVYARIFHLKFDVCAAVRRLGNGCEHTTKLGHELVRLCKGLKRLRSGIYPRTDEDAGKNDLLREDLWMAYLMFLESDGKNARQLIHYSRVDIFAYDYITLSGRLHYGLEDNGGWIVDNEVNALAVWLFWFTDKGTIFSFALAVYCDLYFPCSGRVQSETPTERQSVLQAFAHLFVGSFKVQSRVWTLFSY